MEHSVETLKCQSCGAAVVVRDDAQIARCEQCGQQMAVGNMRPRDEAGNALVASLLRLYCRVMAVLIVYVLSTGPLYWAIYAGYQASGSAFLANLYYPIVWACGKSDLVCTWFDWYVGLWVY